MHSLFQDTAPQGAYRNKLVSAAEAVRLIHDGDTVATGGFVGIGFAESVAVALDSSILAFSAASIWNLKLRQAPALPAT